MPAQLQMALAKDPQFLNRVQYAMAQVALVVIAEAGATPNHAARRVYAAQVLGNPVTAAAALAVGLVGQVNLTTANTVLNPNLSVTTDATDAALFAAVTVMWDAYAGV